MTARIALAGDWHGNTNWATGRIMSLSARHDLDRILHLGDFGIWPGYEGRQYLDAVEKVAERCGITLFVTPGNHEDWDAIDAWPLEDRGHDVGEVAWHRPHIAVLPRGTRWEWEGRSFLSLGGAPSVDYQYRTEGQDWWPAEAITEDDVVHTVEGGYADVMLAHDAPGHPWQVSQVKDIVQHNPMGWPAKVLRYAREGRHLMTEAFLGVQPRLFVHGHYHVRGRRIVQLLDVDYETRIVSLACDEMAGNIALLDLDDLTTEWV